MSSRKKPKTNRKASTAAPAGFDRCMTPAYALDPLITYLRGLQTRLGRRLIIWEPAAGEGHIARVLEQHGFIVIASDFSLVGIGRHVIGGVDFFDWAPPVFDVIVTNPPYSLKYEWYRRAYQLGKPFALLVPIDTLGAQSAQDCYEQFGHEQGLVKGRINFKMPNKGWAGSSAQFATFWSCWQLLPKPVNYFKITRRVDAEVFTPYALLGPGVTLDSVVDTTTTTPAPVDTIDEMVVVVGEPADAVQLTLF